MLSTSSGERDVAESIRAAASRSADSASATVSTTVSDSVSEPAEATHPAEPEFQLGEPLHEVVEDEADAGKEEVKADEGGEKKEEKEEQFFPYPKEYAPPPSDGKEEKKEDLDLDYSDYDETEPESTAVAPPSTPASENVEEELPETKAHMEASEELRILEEEERALKEWLGRNFGRNGEWSSDDGCFEGKVGE